MVILGDYLVNYIFFFPNVAIDLFQWMMYIFIVLLLCFIIFSVHMKCYRSYFITKVIKIKKKKKDEEKRSCTEQIKCEIYLCI